MSDIKVNLDIGPLSQYLENFAKELVKDLKENIEGLAKSTHAHIVKESGKKLTKWDRKKYLENLGQAEQISDFLWEITLAKPATGIEEGRPEWDMKGPPGGLLHVEKPGSKGKIKTTKDRRKYRVIPFKQGKESNTLNVEKIAKQEELMANIKGFLKNKGVPLRKLEIDPRTGAPKIGKLHSFNIPSGIPGKGNTPELHGLTIYQTKNAKGQVKRTMTTFRTAIEGDGKWMRPGIEGKGLFDEARDFAEQQWEAKILPMILDKYKGR